MAKEKQKKKWTTGKIIACILTLVIMFVVVYVVFLGKSSRGLTYELTTNSYAQILGEEEDAYEVSGCANVFDLKKKMVIPAEKKGAPVIGVAKEALRELKAKEIIVEEDSKLMYIEKSAFIACTKLEKINLPESLVFIGETAFYNCVSLKTIEFEGTTAQWNAILKGDRWAEGVPATEVICSDGKVSLEFKL